MLSGTLDGREVMRRQALHKKLASWFSGRLQVFAHYCRPGALQGRSSTSVIPPPQPDTHGVTVKLFVLLVPEYAAVMVTV